MWYEVISDITGWRWSLKMIFKAKKHFLAVFGTSLESSVSARENENLQLISSLSLGAGLATKWHPSDIILCASSALGQYLGREDQSLMDGQSEHWIQGVISASKKFPIRRFNAGPLECSSTLGVSSHCPQKHGMPGRLFTGVSWRAFLAVLLASFELTNQDFWTNKPGVRDVSWAYPVKPSHSVIRGSTTIFSPPEREAFSSIQKNMMSKSVSKAPMLHDSLQHPGFIDSIRGIPNLSTTLPEKKYWKYVPVVFSNALLTSSE